FLKPLFQEQQRRSALPGEDDLLVEYIQTRFGHHLFVYPFDVKLVHEGMAQVLAYRLGKIKPATFSIASNEYVFELLSATSYDLAVALLNHLVSAINPHQVIRYGFIVR